MGENINFFEPTVIHLLIKGKMVFWLLAFPLAILTLDLTFGQQISGYGPVDVAELNPLTLNWNQVHFLVRENLLAIDELRDEQDRIYQELHDCFGLERCRKQENFIDGPPSHGENIQAGALLSALREARLGLEGQQSVLEQSIRQQQRVYESRGSSFRGSRTGSSSYSSSYRSSSSSVNSYPSTQDYDDYYDQGPVPNRG